MIQFVFLKDKLNRLIGFRCENHGRDIVCAAVSILTTNTVNSIEELTEAGFIVNFDDEDGGFMEFLLTDDEIESAAALLMDSLDIGICKLAVDNENDIEIFVKEVNNDD